jgi:GNAT superfamily N-acetyltransferase
VRIDVATDGDLLDLARLLWLLSSDEQQRRQAVEAFADDLGVWRNAHRDTHTAFVARTPETVGMAWLAVLPRLPRPGEPQRRSADVQSVFVLPEHRGRGIGAALVGAATEYARRAGALRATVHSSRLAVPLYERLGFTVSPQHLARSWR